MSSKKGDYQIPFDADGNQLHYPETWHKIAWRDNAPFVATLAYAGFARGRSAAYFVFRTQEGHGVTVFLKDFEAMIPHMVNGVVAGTFTYVKRGQNYGCQRLP